MNKNAYLLIPMADLIDKNLSLLEVATLSQLAYMKKAFRELYPPNAYLADLLNVSIRSIQRAITTLSDKNYITYEVINTNKNKDKRIIKLTDKCNSIYKEIYKNTDYNEIKINKDVRINPILKEFLNR
jgi:DNA-binding MarR family transcriptional regulator